MKPIDSDLIYISDNYWVSWAMNFPKILALNVKLFKSCGTLKSLFNQYVRPESNLLKYAFDSIISKKLMVKEWKLVCDKFNVCWSFWAIYEDLKILISILNMALKILLGKKKCHIYTLKFLMRQTRYKCNFFRGCIDMLVG